MKSIKVKAPALLIGLSVGNDLARAKMSNERKACRSCFCKFLDWWTYCAGIFAYDISFSASSQSGLSVSEWWVRSLGWKDWARGQMGTLFLSLHLSLHFFPLPPSFSSFLSPLLGRLFLYNYVSDSAASCLSIPVIWISNMCHPCQVSDSFCLKLTGLKQMTINQ